MRGYFHTHLLRSFEKLIQNVYTFKINIILPILWIDIHT